ncbi:MAG: hypothetical protein V4456_08820 [Bacteroidota bacterium]
MRIIVLLCGVLLINIAAFSQVMITSEVVAMKLPDGTKTLTDDDYESFIGKTFKLPPSGSYENFYKKGNMIFRYKTGMVSASPQYKQTIEQILAQDVSQREKLLKQTVTDSKISVYNNIRFANVEYNSDGCYYIHFISDHNKQHEYVAGEILFKKKDEAAAREYLNSVLKSFSFPGN